jgi:hypothetical protein
MTDAAAEQSEKPEQPDKAPDADQSTGPIVARAGRYYRNMRYLMFVVFIGMGAWFGYDGWVGWPRMNEQIRKLKDEQSRFVVDPVRNKQINDQLKTLNNGEERNDASIFFQKFLCVALPALGIFVLGRALYKSRGEVRLEGQTLSIPGHPPIPFENITEIDRRLWDKKGIAYIHYDLGEGRSGRALLDDFLYEQAPIDAIYKRVEAFVAPEEEDKDEAKPDAAEGEIQNPNLEIRNKSE